MAAPPDPNTDAGRQQLIALLEPDLHGLLERKEVPVLVQALLAQAGCKSLSRFSAIADDRATMRAFEGNTLQIDRAADPMTMAALVDSWEASKVRMEVRHKAEAEASTSNVPIAVNKVEVFDLRKRFERVFYKLEDKVAPASSTLELLFDEVENGEFKVRYLVQFLSRDDAEVDPLGAMIDRTGVVKIRKGYGETTEPKTPEEFRHRLKVLGHAYMMCGLKYPHRPVLQDLEPQDFAILADYLLGDQVMGLRSTDEEGKVVSAPTLKLVLSYEHQIRKEVTKKMNEGTTMKTALEQARKDVNIKERYFITPASMNALTALGQENRSRSPRGYSHRWESNQRWDHGQWQDGGDRKGKGKGKTKHKGKRDYSDLHSKTPDGREICYKWNSMKERCRFKCGRVHVCQRCLGDHPLHMCKGGKDQGKDTAGTGAGGAAK